MTADFVTNEAFILELESNITEAYTVGVSVDAAEKYAAKFLGAMICLGEELARVDLDARMRKAGVKAIRAGVYLAEVKANEKKPSDTLLEQIVNSSKLVTDEQAAYDRAEVARNRLENLLQVCKEAHVFFRGVSKGRFE